MMNITQLREFLSHLSDDTLNRVERAAANETLVPDVLPEERDRGNRVMYAVRCVCYDRDLTERLAQAETNY